MALASTALGEAIRLRRGDPLADYIYTGFSPTFGYDVLGSDDVQGWPVQPSLWTRYAAPCWKRPCK
jgi:hypothetical protein